MIKDSRKLRPAEVQKKMDLMNQQRNDKKGLASIFDVNNVKSAFQSVLKKRPNNSRQFIIVLGNDKFTNFWNYLVL